MCVKEQDEENYQPALNDIMSIELHRNDEAGARLAGVVPSDYTARRFRYGKHSKNRILAFRRCNDFTIEKCRVLMS